MIKQQESKSRDAILKRLARVEGQIRGIQAMIKRGEDCAAIAQQFSAARSALDKSYRLMLTCLIEEALHKHPAVALAAAVGKPDEKAGELPVVYVQLKPGAQASEAELLAHAAAHIPERAAIPKDVWIIEAIPLTAVGKTFKPSLRFDAIRRTYEQALSELSGNLRVEVLSDERLGQVAHIHLASKDAALAQAVTERLAGFAIPVQLHHGH